MLPVVFTTVVRAAPVERGGELVCVDWDTKRLLGLRTLAPGPPDVSSPTGNGRGGRGVVRRGGRLYVSVYHSVLETDLDLAVRRVISHPLMAGLHESHLDGDSLWVTSTAIDGLLEIGLDGGLRRSWWPREHPTLTERLGLRPLAVDKASDNRALWASGKEQRGPHHTHMNAVVITDGRVHVLLSRFGIVFDVTSGQVLIEDARLKGAHNLLFLDDQLLVNDTDRCTLRIYDRTGRFHGQVEVASDPGVAQLLSRARPRADSKRREGFLRGLARLRPGRVVAGISPASLVEIDLAERRVVDLWTHSEDVAACVHGLLGWDAAAEVSAGSG